MLNTSRAEVKFGFKAKKSFNEGLKKMIEWYRGKKRQGVCEIGMYKWKSTLRSKQKVHFAALPFVLFLRTLRGS